MNNTEGLGIFGVLFLIFFLGFFMGIGLEAKFGKIETTKRIEPNTIIKNKARILELQCVIIVVQDKILKSL